MHPKKKKTIKKFDVDLWSPCGNPRPQPAVEDSEDIIEDIPEAVHSSSEIAAQLQQFSPYTEAPVALHIGEEPTVYYVPSHLLPRGKIHTRGEDPLYLPDIEVETGHTLVHYLYTGTYETLHASSELEQALLVYIMAMSYEIPRLAELVVSEIESLCAGIDIFRMMTSIEPNFTKLELESRDEGPVHAILRKKARTTFEANPTAFQADEFLAHLSNADFRSFMLKCVMKLYSDKVSHLERDREGIRKELKDSKKTVKKFEADWKVDVEQRMDNQNGYVAVGAYDSEPTVREDIEHVAAEAESISTDCFNNISYPSCEDSVQPPRSLDGLEEPQPDESQPEQAPCEELYPEEPCREAYPEPPPEPYPEESEVPAHETPAETIAEPEHAQDELAKILQQMGRSLKTNKAKRALERLERAVRSEKQAVQYEPPQPPSAEEIVFSS
ncbi:BTB domain containing protein [Pyrenophora tritici-repentis]|uniref:Trypan-PARP domain containing protein n=2 Tax=Pyrenophora tritici-repentis TaxID=45151 RepID=A0A2W1DVE6_9PLEO|nr:uncharacterized protein PTRG_11645 [Pyrenophora tritici-repentis Pt-1C-BFP]KAA8627154.1 hypothetical protein PtrV1_02834 [Pyrenophora tritici-repentis]EDU44695.1 predicted protein [Pyrenophora tritici-repentis Pt-1C-BFP]KAF7455590.1 hypothetical protein A1F99_028480 [Pyrenophora tritici-repentis]KAF7578791.1 Trypan-PARP domain containing protein [Pyrenophora tritici-repentis]KAG9389340.1 hypothetical protein A1F94_002233 [Pyrenophora tritici-repentis]